MKYADKWMELENIVQSKAAQTHVFLFIDPNSEILLMSTQPGVTSDNRKVQSTRKKTGDGGAKQ